MKLHNSGFSASFCHICTANKLNRKPPSSKMAFPESSKLELVYSDVEGPIETTSLAGQRYVVSFIGSYSRFAGAYIIKKSQKSWKTFASFVLMKVYLRHSSSRRVSMSASVHSLIAVGAVS